MFNMFITIKPPFGEYVVCFPSTEEGNLSLGGGNSNIFIFSPLIIPGKMMKFNDLRIFFQIGLGVKTTNYR